MAYLDSQIGASVSGNRKPLELSLEILNGLGKAGLVAVPVEPTPRMVAAGMRAGEEDSRTAALIYKAMIAADE